MSLITLIVCICSTSCSYTHNFPVPEPFKQVYGELKPSPSSEVVKPTDNQTLITLSAYKLPFALFARIISDKYKIGFVYGESLADKQITAEFKETDLISFLNVLSRQLSSDVLRIGNTFYIGTLKADDRGVFCRKVFGYTKDQLNAFITPLLTPTGKIATEQSLLIVSDTETVLRRVAELCEQLNCIDRSTWILQLYFVNLRKDALVEAGLATKSSGTVSYDISNQKVNLQDLALEGAFNLLNNSSFGDLYASPMLFVREASESKWSDGDVVPIPQKSVSQYGTTTTTGFAYVNTGLNVTAYCAESSKGAYIKLNISLSEITGYVEYAPIQKSVSYVFESDVVSGKLYLLGELSQVTDLFRQDQTFDFSGSAGKSTVQLWGKVYKLGVPDKMDYPRYNGVFKK